MDLPENWDLIANSNLFLKSDYFKTLEQSAPNNMECFFIGIFKEKELVGIALSQFLDLNQLSSFGERDCGLKAKLRNFLFKRFASHVLFLGNCMLTGPHAFAFNDKLPIDQGITTLLKARSAIEQLLEKKGIKIHLHTFKDFSESTSNKIKNTYFKSVFEFSTQPNMIFTIANHWHTEEDYINSLTKKYRDQYKRARKKAHDLTKRKLNLSEIELLENQLYELYYHVAKNAPFNSFFLSTKHFSNLKKHWKDDFLLYGYFLNDQLIGFNTLIKNGEAMDTYFLGYDEKIQKEKMLYLNMLYDMIAYSIKKKYRTINFARTALEIKSSVGAKPQKLLGFMEHKNPIINSLLPLIFSYLEPTVLWQERNPFK